MLATRMKMAAAGNSGDGESEGWWDYGTCIGAWAAKGAASLAASYTDLSGTGNDLTLGVVPSWNVTNGWVFAGAAPYLKTGIVATASSGWSYAVRLSNFTTGNAFGFYTDGTNQVRIAYSGAKFFAGNGGGVTTGTAIAAGVATIASTDIYFEGADIDNIPSGASGTGEVYIGCVNAGGSPNYYGALYVQALAIYSTTLSSSDVSDLTDAMNAL